MSLSMQGEETGNESLGRKRRSLGMRESLPISGRSRGGAWE